MLVLQSEKREMLPKKSKNYFIPISLFTLLSLTGINWLTIEIVTSQIVVAQSAAIDLPIARQQQESYENFLRRAEASAQKTIQNRFQKDAGISELRIAIVGENQGAIAPILSVRVSRSSWQNAPNIQRWATYYADSKFLLGFEQPIAQPQAETPEEEQPTTPTPEAEQRQPPPETQQPNTPTEEPQPEQPPSPLQRITPGER
jgi:hypothetical protein